jgi:hypothetical protein
LITCFVFLAVIDHDEREREICRGYRGKRKRCIMRKRREKEKGHGAVEIIIGSGMRRPGFESRKG